LFTAVQLSTSGAAVVSSATNTGSAHSSARSLGLLSKDSTIATAQTATVLVGGALSLYALVSTNVAFVASGGTFSGVTIPNKATSASYSNDVRKVYQAISGATGVAALWTAPGTAGTYTVSLYTSSATNQTASDNYDGTLSGNITVTVVASSAGGTYSAAYSLCNFGGTSSGNATGIDSTTVVTNGLAGYVNFDLDDAYDAPLSSGNLIATATNGALVSFGSGAGTASTVVTYGSSTNRSVRVDQGTANAPVTTTVTISHNGTTVCTKTVTIRGEVAKLTIGSIGTQDLSKSDGSATWIADGSGRAGMFTVAALDSAGNIVVPGATSEFSAVAATLTTTVQALSVNNAATNTSSSAAQSLSTGVWTCGSSAGESKVQLQYTNPGSGTIVKSDAFTARCADGAYTYTASFDKASYVQGEIATLTVQFLDSKGNKANSRDAYGALTATTPMLTAVTSHATGVPKADGTRVYTFTVGLSTGITAGTYTAIIDYADLTAVAATKQNPTYKVSTGSTDVSNAEVLKSIVALIASINKQIQALQKLILKK
jgi:hypothetical protein